VRADPVAITRARSRRSTIGVPKGDRVWRTNRHRFGTALDAHRHRGSVESNRGPVILVQGTFGDGAADMRIASTARARSPAVSGGDDTVASAGEFRSSGTSVFGEGKRSASPTSGTVRLQDGRHVDALTGWSSSRNAGG